MNDRRLLDLWQRHNALRIKLSVVSPECLDMTLGQARERRLQLQKCVGGQFILPIAYNAICVDAGPGMGTDEMRSTLRDIIKSSCASQISKSWNENPTRTGEHHSDQRNRKSVVSLSDLRSLTEAQGNATAQAVPIRSASRHVQAFSSTGALLYSTDCGDTHATAQTGFQRRNHTEQQGLSTHCHNDMPNYRAESQTKEQNAMQADPNRQLAVKKGDEVISSQVQQSDTRPVKELDQNYQAFAKDDIRQALMQLNSATDSSASSLGTLDTSLSFHSDIVDYAEYKSKARSASAGVQSRESDGQNAKAHIMCTLQSMGKRKKQNEQITDIKAFSCKNSVSPQAQTRVMAESPKRTIHQKICTPQAACTPLQQTAKVQPAEEEKLKSSIADSFEQRSSPQANAFSTSNPQIQKNQTYAGSYEVFRQFMGAPQAIFNAEHSRSTLPFAFQRNGSKSDAEVASDNFESASPVSDKETRFSKNCQTMHAASTYSNHLSLPSLANAEQPTQSLGSTAVGNTVQLRHSIQIPSMQSDFHLQKKHNWLEDQDTPFPPLKQSPEILPPGQIEQCARKHSIRYPDQDADKKPSQAGCDSSKLRKRRRSSEFIAQQALLERAATMSSLDESYQSEHTLKNEDSSKPQTHDDGEPSILELPAQPQNEVSFQPNEAKPRDMEDFQVQIQVAVKRKNSDQRPALAKQQKQAPNNGAGQSTHECTIAQEISHFEKRRPSIAAELKGSQISRPPPHQQSPAALPPRQIVQQIPRNPPQSGLLDFSAKLYNQELADGIISNCENDRWRIGSRLAGQMMRSYQSLLDK